MGSLFETNDTLQLTAEQGFPAHLLDRQKHCVTPIKLQDVTATLFSFRNKANARLFQLDPVRVYLVQNKGSKWLYWGRALIQTLVISKRLQPDSSWKEGDWMTSGTYKIIDLYDPEYQKLFTIREAPKDCSYFAK